MKTFSDTSVKVFSKIPKVSLDTDWITEKIEKLSLTYNGYAKLKSGMISRSRLTMADKSDEQATAAWSAEVWKKGSGVKEWPKELRPQRPEQYKVEGYKGKEPLRTQAYDDVDVLENPPIFLTIKDIRRMKEERSRESGTICEGATTVSTSRSNTPRKNRPRREIVGGVTKDSPRWPSALLTFDAENMGAELEMLGLQLIRDVKLCQEELKVQQVHITDLNHNLSLSNKEVAMLKAQLAESKEEIQTLQAQLQVRTEATLRLEQDNTELRDTIAKYRVQIEANNLERQNLVEKCQALENERILLKSKYKQLEKSENSSAQIKSQCYHLQLQIKGLVNQISSQQEVIRKDHAKVERTVQEALNFTNTLSKHSKVQALLVDKVVTTNARLKKEITNLSVQLSALQKEKFDLQIQVRDPKTHELDATHLILWEKYQKEMQKRLDGYMDANNCIMEELTMLRSIIDQNNSKTRNENYGDH